jgi:hypothetical protein
LRDAWARYEYMYADLGAVQKLETRFAEVFPNGESAAHQLGLALAPRPVHTSTTIPV